MARSQATTPIRILKPWRGILNCFNPRSYWHAPALAILLLSVTFWSSLILLGPLMGIQPLADSAQQLPLAWRKIGEIVIIASNMNIFLFPLIWMGLFIFKRRLAPRLAYALTVWILSVATIFGFGVWINWFLG